MLVNKESDTVDTIKKKAKKFLDTEKGSRVIALELETGEPINDIKLLEKNDRVLVKLIVPKLSAPSVPANTSFVPP